MITTRQTSICHKIADEITKLLQSDGHTNIHRTEILNGICVETNTPKSVYAILCDPEYKHPNLDPEYPPQTWYDLYTIKQLNITEWNYAIHATTSDTDYIHEKIKSMVNYYRNHIRSATQ